MRDQGGEGARGTAGRDAVARVRQELAQLGVGEAARDELARRLAPMIRGLSSEAYAAALAGAALAHAVQRDQEEALREALRDLGEVQRLLGAFGEELCRLDEALRMLSHEVQHAGDGRLAARAPERRRLH